MITIVNGSAATFSKYKFIESQSRSQFENYAFTNQRAITRSLLTWFAYSFADQKLLDLKQGFDIEHIYSRKRQEIDGDLENELNLESLGNKILLEESINIRASDYRFDDKKKIYSGVQRRGKYKDPSQIHEISTIIELSAFSEEQIIDRTQVILDRFFEFLKEQELIESS
ncbi:MULTISPECIES: DUF1524 domain-containing protein [unclassified Cyanobium]|uniref:GmrSD restriction endonuclease domain-containing protein n=1 Tax=unclassified Cyanobium TaxID=2627006 RepID=UPI0037BEABC9